MINASRSNKLNYIRIRVYLRLFYHYNVRSLLKLAVDTQPELFRAARCDLSASKRKIYQRSFTVRRSKIPLIKIAPTSCDRRTDLELSLYGARRRWRRRRADCESAVKRKVNKKKDETKIACVCRVKERKWESTGALVVTRYTSVFTTRDSRTSHADGESPSIADTLKFTSKIDPDVTRMHNRCIRSTVKSKKEYAVLQNLSLWIIP